MMKTNNDNQTAPFSGARLFYIPYVYKATKQAYKKASVLPCNSMEIAERIIADNFPDEWENGHYKIDVLDRKPIKPPKNWYFSFKLNLDNQTVTYQNQQNNDLSLTLFFYRLPISQNRFDELNGAGFVFLSKPIQLAPGLSFGFYLSNAEKENFLHIAETTGIKRGGIGLFLDVIELGKLLLMNPVNCIYENDTRLNSQLAAPLWREFLQDNRRR